MERVRSGVVSKALGISTDGLRKQRQRGTSKYDYEVVDGRVFYDLNSFPPSVRSHIEKLTTKRTKQKHDDIKSPQYWNSIGRINERRIKDRKRRIEGGGQERLAEERAEQYHNNGPLKREFMQSGLTRTQLAIGGIQFKIMKILRRRKLLRVITDIKKVLWFCGG